MSYGTLDNVVGLKLGSEFSVLCTQTSLVKQLTCVYERPSHIVRNDVQMVFSYDADQFAEGVYPLRYGMPRNDADCRLDQSLRYLHAYATWILTGLPTDIGIIFCVPLMDYKEGLTYLKNALNQLPWGTRGREFVLEAWAGAVGAVGIEQALKTHILSINFGSTTTEVLLQAGKKRVHHAIHPYGGSNLDVDLLNAIGQAHRGATVTRSVARTIKEQFSIREPKSIPASLVREGARVDVEVLPETILPVIRDYAVRIAKWIGGNFLPRAAEVNEKAVTAIQVHGQGTVVACGGMVNMPGFSDLVFDTLWKVCGLNPKVQHVSPSDGITAPAVGCKLIGDVFETECRNARKGNWSELL